MVYKLQVYIYAIEAQEYLNQHGTKYKNALQILLG